MKSWTDGDKRDLAALKFRSHTLKMSAIMIVSMDNLSYNQVLCASMIEKLS